MNSPEVGFRQGQNIETGSKYSACSMKLTCNLHLVSRSGLVELYLCSPNMPLWCGQGQLYLYHRISSSWFSVFLATNSFLHVVLWCSPQRGVIQHARTPHHRTDSSVAQHYFNDSYNAAFTLSGTGVI
jgi:hypothetical protein